MSWYWIFKRAIDDSKIKEFLDDVVVEENVLTNATISSVGSSGNILIKGSKTVEVLIRVGGVTGTPSVTFSVDVIEPQSGEVVVSYSGTALTAAGTDSIIITESQVKGSVVRVSWSGTVDSLNYLTGVYVTLIGKR